MKKFFILFQISLFVVLGLYIKMNYTLITLTSLQIADLETQKLMHSSVLLSAPDGSVSRSNVLIHIGRFALVNK